MSEYAPLIIHYEGTSPTNQELKDALEKGDLQTKINTLKTLIKLQVSGESQTHFIMTVIKYCVPVDDHTMKKLCIYFWESVDKLGDDGKALQEIVLLCSFLRNDLQHANEYVRGVTLRFLCKVREREVLENLVSALLPNLSFDDAYVRRNAILAVHSVYSRFPDLMPDGPELVEKALATEKDVSARRHGLNMLYACAPERAIRVLAALRDSSEEPGEALQLAMVDVARQLIAAHPYDRAAYLPFILSAVHSKSPSVLYQCACTLLTISSSPTAITTAANTLTQLLATHSDSNAKLIILDRLEEMKGKYLRTLQDSLMDILRSLSSASATLRQRVIALSVDLVCARNIENFTVAMKKELVRSQSDEVGDKDAQQAYRLELVRALHTAVLRHLDLAPAVVPIMLDYVCESGDSSYHVLQFLREVAFSRPEMQPLIFERLVMLLPMVSSSKVLRTMLWLFCALANTGERIGAVVDAVKEAMSPFPLVQDASSKLAAADAAGPTPVTTTVVREDGTYVTNVVMVDKRQALDRADVGLRALILGADFFLASSLLTSISKLIVRLQSTTDASKDIRHKLENVALEVVEEVIQYSTQEGRAPSPVDVDNHERMMMALTLLRNPKNDFVMTLPAATTKGFEEVLAEQQRQRGAAASADPAAAAAAMFGGRSLTDGAESSVEQTMGDVEQPMVFTQLVRGKQALFDFEATNDDVQRALADVEEMKANDFVSSLRRVVQLSGFSDPVYAEATVHVHQFDVSLDITVINQTNQTLNNLTVELGTQGDIKLCERPQPYVMPAGALLQMKVNLKVCSTDRGVVFGSILFETEGGEVNTVVLNQVTIGIMEYIREGVCSASKFRELWANFEWENKFGGFVDFTPHEFVHRIAEKTHLRPIEPLGPEEDCEYVSALLYAKSTFEEHVLANLSMEQSDTPGRYEFVIRLRSKTEGIAKYIGQTIQGILATKYA